MKEEIKELCFFMICGQTLLHFQSGKKYERICRMIFQLLILAGIAGVILNFLQSVGFQGGELTADGGAVSNMQRSMEEALSRQLGDVPESDFLQGLSTDEWLEKYTLEEIKSRYNYVAEKHGLQIERMERDGENLLVYVKSNTDAAGKKLDSISGMEASGIKIPSVEIEEIALGEEEEETGGDEEDQEAGKEAGQEAEGQQELSVEKLQAELADIFMVEEARLEVICID